MGGLKSMNPVSAHLNFIDFSEVCCILYTSVVVRAVRIKF